MDDYEVSEQGYDSGEELDHMRAHWERLAEERSSQIPPFIPHPILTPSEYRSRVNGHKRP